MMLKTRFLHLLTIRAKKHALSGGQSVKNIKKTVHSPNNYLNGHNIILLKRVGIKN